MSIFVKFLLILLLAAEGLVLLCYLVVLLYRKWEKTVNIRNAANIPEGEFFEKESKSAKKVSEYIEDVLLFTQEYEDRKLKYQISESLHEKIDGIRKSLRSQGITRKLKIVNVNVKQNKSGRLFRVWNYGGKEWNACDMNTSIIEQYTSNSNHEVLCENYYPSVLISYTMSRRLKDEDLNALQRKDKWGRQIVKKEEFYKDKILRNCPSCGAELPENLKDIVCPYCGSSIYSDYYDWQIESLEIQPRRMQIRGFFGWVHYLFEPDIFGSEVKNKRKEKIVRFSPNDFRQDVYESVLDQYKQREYLDIWIGAIEVTSIRNTDDETFLKIKVPVYITESEQRNGVLELKTSREILSATFKRVRYPNRFQKKNTVISAEKQCPNCGGTYAPDEKGNCTYCGTFLFKDNIKWKRVN